MGHNALLAKLAFTGYRIIYWNNNAYGYDTWLIRKPDEFLAFGFTRIPSPEELVEKLKRKWLVAKITDLDGNLLFYNYEDLDGWEMPE